MYRITNEEVKPRRRFFDIREMHRFVRRQRKAWTTYAIRTTRRSLFGFGDDKTADGGNKQHNVLWAYLQRLKRQDRLGSDDLLHGVLDNSADSFLKVDDALVERMQQLASLPDGDTKDVYDAKAGDAPTAVDVERVEPEVTPSSQGQQQRNETLANNQPGLTPSQALKTEREILERLKTAQSRMALMAIKNVPNLTLDVRWQQMMGVLLGTQAQAIAPLGFTQDQHGLLTYTTYRNSLAASPGNETLRKAMGDCWDYCLEIAFGVTETKAMTTEVARQFTADVHDRMTDDAFMKRIDAVFEKHGVEPGFNAMSSQENTDTMMKVQAELFPLMFEAQIDVAEKHGYGGDEGYVMSQRALMDHANDPKVQENTNKMQTTLFKRLGAI